MLRLTIFAINYSPEPTGAALNTTGIATGAVERGWSVTVVTGIPHYPSWRPGRAPSSERRDGVCIRRYGHFVPATQSMVTRGLYEATWYGSALRALARTPRPDLVLGVSPSLGGAALARTAAALYRRPYCLLFQDLVGRAASQSGISGGSLVAGALGATERWLAKDAAAVMVVAEGFRDHFPRARRVVRVRNPVRLAPPTATREEARAARGWREGQTVVLHSGSIGYKQDLERVLDVAEITAGAGVHFVFQGDGSLRPALERAAAGRGLGAIEFRPLDPEDELANTLLAADVLLVHQRSGVRNMSLPAKLGTYLASGRPVLAVVEADDEVAREVRASGGGIVVRPGDSAAIAATILSLREDPARAAALGRGASDFAARELSPQAAIDAIDLILRTAASGVGSRTRSDEETGRASGA